MGRQSLDKVRIKDPMKREVWIKQLMPIFFKHGIKEISPNRIAAEINKSKATVYKHFDSHKEVVMLIIEMKLTSLQKFSPLLEDESVSYPDRYQKTVEYVSTELKDVGTVFLSDLKAVYPDLWELISAFKKFAINELRSFYIKGVKAKVFADISPDLLAKSDELFFDILTDADYLKSIS